MRQPLLCNLMKFKRCMIPSRPGSSALPLLQYARTRVQAHYNSIQAATKLFLAIYGFHSKLRCCTIVIDQAAVLLKRRCSAKL